MTDPKFSDEEIEEFARDFERLVERYLEIQQVRAATSHGHMR